MRRLTGLLAVAFALGLGSPARAATIQVELRNQSSDTIYVVTAFASELVANNRNLTTIPLPAGSKRTVSIFDVYNKCIFTFTVNFNRPPQPGRKPPTRQRAKPFRVIPDIDICRAPAVTVR